METSYILQVIDMEDQVICVPLGIPRELIQGVYALSREAYDQITESGHIIDQEDIERLLADAGDSTDDIEIIEIEATELAVIRDLCEKAMIGNCSQYTYQNLINRLNNYL